MARSYKKTPKVSWVVYSTAKPYKRTKSKQARRAANMAVARAYKEDDYSVLTNWEPIRLDDRAHPSDGKTWAADHPEIERFCRK